MASKRFKFTFEDDCEYEATVTSGGAVEIRSESGKVVFDCGPFTTRDVMEILAAIKDEVESKDPNYQNWIEETEEVERMDIPESVNISGWPCKFHSMYKGWALYRAWDFVNDHGKMLYFAIDATTSDHRILEAGNLDGIKKRVLEVA